MLLIKKATSHLKEQERSKLLLQEWSFSLFIFQTFERSVYQLQNAKTIKSIWNSGLEKSVVLDQRIKFLEEVVMYFSKRLLRNPRLLYYWNPSGGNLVEYFEEGTKKYYLENVFELTINSENVDGLIRESSKKDVSDILLEDLQNLKEFKLSNLNILKEHFGDKIDKIIPNCCHLEYERNITPDFAGPFVNYQDE